MPLIQRRIKVNPNAERVLAKKLGVDTVLFKRLKYVNTNVQRFTYFIYNEGDIIGTLNVFWDLRKSQQKIFLRRFKDKKVKSFNSFNNSSVFKFFRESL